MKSLPGARGIEQTGLLGAPSGMIGRKIRRTVGRTCLVLGAALGVALGAESAAWAVPAGGPPAPASAPVVLVTGSLPPNVDVAVLRARLAAELGTPLLDAPPPDGAIRGTLHLGSTKDELMARFTGRDGSVTQRAVPLPTGKDRVLFTLVVLAGNVARDEAAELLAEIARRKPSGGQAPADAGSGGGADGGAAADPESDAGAPAGDDGSGEAGEPCEDGEPGEGRSCEEGDPARDEPCHEGEPCREGESEQDEPCPQGGPTCRRSAPRAVARAEAGAAATAIAEAGAGASATAVARAGASVPICAVSGEQPVIVAGADFVPMLGVSLAAPDALLYASLNVVGGRAGAIRGVQIGSVLNLVSGGACGVQIGGVVNVARGAGGVQIGGVVNAVERVRGVQIAGAVNVVREMAGVQIAGAVNIGSAATGLQIGGALNASEDVAAGQITGGVNLADGMRGIQIAGGLNRAAEVRGAQITGGLNIAGRMDGLQIAGGLNRSTGMRGVQIAGGLDLTGDAAGLQIAGGAGVASAMRGLQIAPIAVAGKLDGAQVGAINIAGRVRGVQIGAVNIAEESDLSIGAVSIVRRGRSHLDVWGSETGLFMAAFKHGGRYFHNFYGAGVRPFGDAARIAFNLGIGGHIPVSQRFFVDVDTLAYSLHRPDDMGARPVFLAQGRVMVGARLLTGLALVAGPSFNVSFAATREDAALSPLGAAVLHERTNLSVQGWPGATIGIQTF